VFVCLQVCNALHHLPHCIKYMQDLRDRDVFRFCAIPQIMAIGTLALCYNNGAVFEGESWSACCSVMQAGAASCRDASQACITSN
jgi:phytoene/squalene synthetase